MKENTLFQGKFLSPKYWPAWTLIGLLYLCAYLPFRFRLVSGRLFGLLGYYLARNRRYIAEVTIRKCFPEFDAASQERLVKNCFMENGIGIVESGSVWVRGARPFIGRHRFHGADSAIAAINKGQGVLILIPHYSSMDFIAAMISLHFPFSMSYRPNSNALFNAFIQKGRKHYCSTIDRNNTLGMVRELKQGGAVWYAPDQDFARPEHTVFAPFFGNSAATLTAAGRIAEMTGSAVFCLSHYRNDNDTHYGNVHEMSLVPLESTYPSGDALADATTMNRYFEAAIRQAPSQYLWMHKRFKTQPGGKPESPYIRSRTFCKTISPDLYRELISGSDLEDGHEAALASNKIVMLTNGLLIKLFEGIPRQSWVSRHPALRFDRLAKEIRSRGIGSVTPDNIFKVVHLNITGVTYHPLAGKPLGNLIDTLEDDNLQTIMSYLVQSHSVGVLPDKNAISSLYVSSAGCSISEPLGVRLFPSSLSYADRAVNLADTAQLLKLSEAERPALYSLYREIAGLSGNKQFEAELAKRMDTRQD